MLLLLAAPPGLEPRKPESEAGVLPIRLKGNMWLGIRESNPYWPGVKVLRATITPIPNINKTQYRNNLILSQTRKPFRQKSQKELSMGFEPTIF